ncbi:MAG: 2-polyprenyl-3-methyl-6-methoxy-1,4-benzoquinone monooxygenase [Gammaproteobacteria bacterium]|jgi:ubiquinone biosynthesis monooxygenase Coq7|nr:2-polyprenyl-3-methyl-6-methoxy-1,4-benzoquinone monooxygenase [Gammaproteobacteria bacterium]
MRDYTPIDRLLMNVDTALRTVAGKPLVTQRANPAEAVEECDLQDQDRKHVAGLMRVNHAGEVSAQALYQGQALTARNNEVREKLEQAALEENDHLAWTESRLHELGDRTSYLNPIWYTGSLAIGAFAGALGDKWSLGFLAETEHQVVRHLDSHLKELPKQDQRSRAILEQMRIDEARHATTALDHGGAELPAPVKGLMSLMSKVMTKTTYRI